MLLLQKLLSLLLSPLLQALVLWLIAFIVFSLGYRRIAWGASISGFLWLVIMSMPLTSRALLHNLEKDYPPIPMEQVAEAQAIVLLGGGISAASNPLAGMNLHEAADRVRYAARLFHAGKAPLIVVAAGNLPWSDAAKTEALVTSQLLQELGVPSSAILVEGNSQTTRQNAINSWHLLHPHSIKKVLLVTSAWHMRRASATFEQLGFSVIPAATDWAGLSKTIMSEDFVPQGQALLWIEIVVHE